MMHFVVCSCERDMLLIRSHRRHHNTNLHHSHAVLTLLVNAPPTMHNPSSIHRIYILRANIFSASNPTPPAHLDLLQPYTIYCPTPPTLAARTRQI